jgi:hypothetical protein
MRHEVAETMREALLLGIVEMRLIAEKHHLVPQKYLVDSRYGLLRQIAGKPYVSDFCADTSRKRDYVGFRDGLLYGCKFGHGKPLSSGTAGCWQCSAVTGRTAIGGATPLEGANLLIPKALLATQETKAAKA